MKRRLLFSLCTLVFSHTAFATLVTDPDDARLWQGADVGTFANLFYGSNTLANRTLVVNNQLLDDGNFNVGSYAAASMLRYNNVDVIANPGAGNYGTSFDQAGSSNVYDGSYAYSYSGAGAKFGGDFVDQNWIQTDNVIGHSIWDLGFQADKAAVFNTIDHGPLPQESIESTVYLSNDMLNWAQAETQRVWLEGIYSDTSVLWDGFVYAVGAPNGGTFRYASVIWGGPGALIADGDNEINGIMGLRSDFQAGPDQHVPEPVTLSLLGIGLAGIGLARKRKKQKLGLAGIEE